MLRFLGEHFGFDIDTVRRVMQVRELISENGTAGWRYAGVEIPYPMPDAFVTFDGRLRQAHIWTEAWRDLERTNPQGSSMIKNLLTSEKFLNAR